MAMNFMRSSAMSSLRRGARGRTGISMIDWKRTRLNSRHCVPAALPIYSGPGGLAVAGGHGDEFHEVERDVFVAAGAQGKNGHFHDRLEENTSELPSLRTRRSSDLLRPRWSCRSRWSWR